MTRNAESDALRETLTDFAIWSGESREDAEWSAETYLRERDTPGCMGCDDPSCENNPWRDTTPADRSES